MTSVDHDHPVAAAAACAEVDALLDTDLGAMDDAAVHELMVAMQRVRARLAVVSADVLAEWDQRRVWQNNGLRSPAHRFARETRSAVSTGRAELDRARALRHLPHTRQAVLAGRLSWDHVDLFASACTPERRDLFAEHEAAIVAECSKVPFFDAVRIIRHWQVQADDHLAAERGEPDQPAQPTSKLYASSSLDGRLVIQGELDPIDGEIVKDELDRLAEEVRLADLKAGRDRTPAQRRAAALVEMASRSKVAPADGRRPQPLFTVVIGDRSFERLCELASGAVLRTGELLPHLDQAMLESILFDGPTTVLGVSRRRSFIGALRRAIQVRDRRCRHASECDVPAAQCDIDHTLRWIDHGETSQFNGSAQCKPHNRIERLHGPPGTPLPHRPIHRVDLVRARLRWQHVRDLEREGTVDEPVPGCSHASCAS
jgi:hypothetical protein